MNIEKRRFIDNLAHFLSSELAAKSIALEIEVRRAPNSPMPKFAAEWAKLRNLAGVHGYSDVKETTKTLEKLLGK